MPSPREIIEAELKGFREKADETERELREFERIVAKYGFLVIATPSKPLAPAERISRTNFPLAIREAESIIRSTGKPLTAAELFRRIVIERNIPLTGDEPVSMLVAYMASNENLQYLKDLGRWWIKGISWPPNAEEIAKMQKMTINELALQSPAIKPVRSVLGGQHRTPEKQRLLDALKEIFKARGVPMKFAEVFDELKSRDIPIGGTDERSNLAGFLAKFPCFVNKGRGVGWEYLAERDYEANPQMPEGV